MPGAYFALFHICHLVGGTPHATAACVFPVDSIASSVQLYNGRTIVIGGGVPSKDGKTFTCILITATLVDPSGEEVSTETDADTFEPCSVAGE